MKNNITEPAAGIGAIGGNDPELEALQLAKLKASVGDSPFLKLLNERSPEQVRADLEALAAAYNNNQQEA